MKNLTLSISSEREGEPMVTLTAKFDNTAEAIKFHAKVSSLCSEYSQGQPEPWGRARVAQLLTQR